jgi:hypothetical protein
MDVHHGTGWEGDVMTSVTLRARAKTPKPCCMAKCTLAGNKIFESSDGLRLIACSQGHAEYIARFLNTPPPGMDRETFLANRDRALRLFNERLVAGAVVAGPVESGDYDIDFD